MKQDKKGVKRALDDPEEQKRNKTNMDELIEEEAKILYDHYLQKDYSNEDALIFVEAYLAARKVNQYTTEQASSFAEAYLSGINKGLNKRQATHYAHQIVAGFPDETAKENALAMPY